MGFGFAGAKVFKGGRCMGMSATPTKAINPPMAILIVSDSPRNNIPPITEVTGSNNKKGMIKPKGSSVLR
ncbi:MAG: hypothetical protein GY820_05705 [Gammaproteobacteria bacterium]|nr:hypothetical protein [Gammaproteobacteria bacterium]